MGGDFEEPVVMYWRGATRRSHFHPNPLGTGRLVNLTLWLTDRQLEELQFLLSIAFNIRFLAADRLSVAYVQRHWWHRKPYIHTQTNNFYYFYIPILYFALLIYPVVALSY